MPSSGLQEYLQIYIYIQIKHPYAFNKSLKLTFDLRFSCLYLLSRAHSMCHLVYVEPGDQAQELVKAGSALYPVPGLAFLATSIFHMLGLLAVSSCL